MSLWHGPSNTAPHVIYADPRDVGLSVDYGNAGSYWGRAVYMAKNAAYSHAYAHQLPAGGQRQMFLMDVRPGAVEHNVPQRVAGQTITGPSDGFTCIHGVTQGHDVYMLYASSVADVRCYPHYLVTDTAL